MYKAITLMLLGLFFADSVNSQNFNLTSKNVASDRSVSTNFGTVTYLNDNIALVGNPNDYNNLIPGDSINNAGSVYVYSIDTYGNWTELQKLVASNRSADSYFGSAVCANDSNIIIGAPNAYSYDGAIYIFKKDSLGYWQENQIITGSNTEGLGFSLDIKGNQIVIGAPFASVGPYSSSYYLDLSGVVYIGMEQSNGNWQINNGFEANDRAEYATFGFPVKFSADGNIIAGAYGESLDENGANSLSSAGAVYVFTDSGSQLQKIVASDRAEYATFGLSISTFDDLIAIGAPHKNGSSIQEGAVYMFKKDTSGTYQETQIITSSLPYSENKFGYSVSMYENKLAIGEYKYDFPFVDNGGVHIYEKDSLDNWNLTDTITNNEIADEFGNSVFMYKNKLLVGAAFNDMDENETNSMSDAGAVYFYKSCGALLSSNIISICDGDSVFVGGNYQSISGFYYDTLQSVLHCDSVIENELIVNANPTMFQVIGQISANEFETLTYSVPFDTSLNYQWFVNGGNIISFLSNNSVNIQWGTSAYGLISVVASNESGCESDTAYLQVNIGTVNISENNKLDFSIYPNPASSFVQVKSDKLKVENCSLLDVYGRTIQEFKVQSSEFKIQIEDLSKGIYFIKLQTNKGPVVKKFIKQ